MCACCAGADQGDLCHLILKGLNDARHVNAQDINGNTGTLHTTHTLLFQDSPPGVSTSLCCQGGPCTVRQRPALEGRRDHQKEPHE